MEFIDVFIAFAQALTLVSMLIGLIGLIVPIFPGLVIIWLSALFYIIIQAATAEVGGWGWAMFIVSTILMAVGSVIDNIMIGKKVIESGASWWSIGAGILTGLVASLFFTPLVGLLAAPAGLYLAEYRRLGDKEKAKESTKAWLIGFGSAFVIRFIIGVVMIALWAVWAFSQ